MKQRADLTFKENILRGRHGWLRLTPAYSVKVVHQILDEHPHFKHVLEPFSGTATTGLVCGETGISANCFDINPFLVWFGKIKTATYEPSVLEQARRMLSGLSEVESAGWFPPLHEIEKWWQPTRLETLSALHGWLEKLPDGLARNLLLVAFCRCVIEWSNAAFNHQSMSFKTADKSLFEEEEKSLLLGEYRRIATKIITSAESPIIGKVEVKLADARKLPSDGMQFDALITSPPYPNRMSYIRELRPYMYWMRFLTDARQAGELDWQSIGGTWGIATSLVGAWKPNGSQIEHEGFSETIEGISVRSPLLSRYVHKYFVDIRQHIQSAATLLKRGASVFYIVGNSKFYDTMVHVEEIYASLLRGAGFVDVTVHKLRKRNSKKELYEFAVSGRWRERTLPQ